MEASIDKLKEVLSSCRRVTICLDGWTKKGLSSSFLGISACFYDPKSNSAQHALLNLNLLEHPHTGEMLSKCLEESLKKWEIPEAKVMLIVSDNGANMVKAIRLLRERAESSNDQSSGNEEAVENDEEEEGNGEELGDAINLVVDNISYRRLGCLAHTLQLLVKEAYNGDYSELLTKTRTLVGKIRKSSVAMEKIVQSCGKSPVSDNTTRWNSTYLMVRRLLEIKLSLNKVLADMNIDSLLTSEWGRLEEIVSLLEPFASQTDVLQTDALSLSYIIPSLLNLECHLDQFPSNKILINSMLQNLQKRFAVMQR